MDRQRFLHGRWQQHAPIVVALARADDDLLAGNVHVRDAETQTLQQAQAGTVYEADHPPVDAVERIPQRYDLVSGRHHRYPLPPLGADDVLHPAARVVEAVPGQKAPRIERLMLGHGAHRLLQRQR
jgi:hypothetical protein